MCGVLRGELVKPIVVGLSYWLKRLRDRGWDKMVAIFRRHIQIQFFNENCDISIQISLNFVPKDPIYNKSALVEIMSWCKAIIRTNG